MSATAPPLLSSVLSMNSEALRHMKEGNVDQASGMLSQAIFQLTSGIIDAFGGEEDNGGNGGGEVEETTASSVVTESTVSEMDSVVVAEEDEPVPMQPFDLKFNDNQDRNSIYHPSNFDASPNFHSTAISLAGAGSPLLSHSNRILSMLLYNLGLCMHRHLTGIANHQLASIDNTSRREILDSALLVYDLALISVEQFWQDFLVDKGELSLILFQICGNMGLLRFMQGTGETPIQICIQLLRRFDTPNFSKMFAEAASLSDNSTATSSSNTNHSIASASASIG